MTVYEAIAQLRSDLDDQVDLNQIFSDLQLAKFLSRAMKETAAKEPSITPTKDKFIILTGLKNIEDLPSDYIRMGRVYDSKNHRNLSTSPIPTLEQFGTGQPTAYFIDSKRNKIVWDNVPDPDIYNLNVFSGVLPTGFFTIPALQYIDLVSDTRASIAYFFSSPYIRITNGPYTVIYRVAMVEDETTTIGADTYVCKRCWLSEADCEDRYVTDVSTFFAQTSALPGLLLIGQNSKVINGTLPWTSFVQPGDLLQIGTRAVVINTIVTTTRATAIQDSDIAVAPSAAVYYPSRVNLVDYVMEYEYNPADVWWRMTDGNNAKLSLANYCSNTLIVVANSFSTNNLLDANLVVGDSIFVPRLSKGLVDDGEAQIIRAVGSSNYTLEVVYSFTPATGCELYGIGTSEQLPFPIEIHPFIVELASYYAYKRIGDDNLASNQLDKAMEIIERYKASQQYESAENFNNRSISQYQSQLDSNPWRRFGVTDTDMNSFQRRL